MPAHDTAPASGDASGAIAARPTHEARARWGPFALYHGRYRGFAAKPHQHAEAQLLLPLSGRMHLLAGDEERLLGPEGLVWVPAHTRHGFTHVDGALDFVALELPWPIPQLGAPGSLGEALALAAELPRPGDVACAAHSTGLWLTGQALARELDRHGPDGLALNDAGPKAKARISQALPLGEAAEALAPRGGSATRASEAVLGGLVLALLGELHRAQSAPPATQTTPEVLKAMQAMLARYPEALRIPELAAELAISPRQLERRFQAELGQTPKAFLHQVRLAAAEVLLRGGDRPVGEVGLAVGFATPAHFATSFAARHGLSPSAYRKAARAQA